MKALTVKLPENLDAGLSQEARRQGLNRSQFVRRALEIFLGQQPKAGSGSCLDRASDLAGCCRATRDLSTNPSHLDDFSR